MKIKPIAGLCIIAMWLSGCSMLGPRYNQPQVQVPNKWQHGNENKNLVTSSANLSDVSWWRKFNDPELNQLLDEALANNNDIQEAIGNITTAAGKLQQVHMAWVPTIDLGGTAGTTNINLNNPAALNQLAPSFQGSSITQNYYAAGLIPAYSINVFQQIDNQKAANANLAAAVAQKNATRLAVISQVVGSYFTLLSLNEQLHEEQQLITDLSELVKLTEIQYHYGLIDETPLQQVQEQLSQAKMQLPALKTNVVMVNNALSVLIGKSPMAIKVSKPFMKVELSGLIPVNMPSQVLNNRPDIMQAEAQLKLAGANIGLARAKFFPQIMLFSPPGFYNMQLTNLFSSSGTFWANQIIATMPILNLGILGLIKQAKGQYYVAYYNYIKTVENAFSEVDTNLSGYTQNNQMLRETNAYYKTANSIYKLKHLGYTKGSISYPASLSSKISEDNVAIMLSQAKLQQLQSIVKLYQSLAGGYNYQNTETPKSFGDDRDA